MRVRVRVRVRVCVRVRVRVRVHVRLSLSRPLPPSPPPLSLSSVPSDALMPWDVGKDQRLDRLRHQARKKEQLSNVRALAAFVYVCAGSGEMPDLFGII